MPTITMSLQEKVRAIVTQEGGAPFEAVAQQPGKFDFHATDLEAAMCAWGCVYGIAFGLARSEEPCEPHTSVASRAYEAAWPVFAEFNGGRLDTSPAAREVYQGEAA